MRSEVLMRYILEKKKESVYSFLTDDSGHAVEIHVDAPAQGPQIGDIYVALVQKTAKNLNAAFVELIPGISGYLPFDEIVRPIYVSKGPSPELQAGDQLDARQKLAGIYYVSEMQDFYYGKCGHVHRVAQTAPLLADARCLYIQRCRDHW